MCLMCLLCLLCLMCLMTVSMCWCVWCIDVLMCWRVWCVDEMCCVDVFGVSMCQMTVLMCWCVDVLMCWCVDVLMCRCPKCEVESENWVNYWKCRIKPFTEKKAKKSSKKLEKIRWPVVASLRTGTRRKESAVSRLIGHKVSDFCEKLRENWNFWKYRWFFSRE
jgi:hypothetical protein